MHAATKAAVLVALMGATAAPIAATPLIDLSNLSTFGGGTEVRLMMTLPDSLLSSSAEPSETATAPATLLPEPPAGLLSASGIGAWLAVFWRRRIQLKRKAHRRKRFEIRELARLP